MLKQLLSIDKNSTKEFWLSHTLILLSTVFAVYLAAKAGLDTAVQFELVQSDRNSYYLQSSLMDEFKDNTEQVIEMCETIMDERYALYLGQRGKHELDKFVWTAMQDSADTFEIPSTILTGVRRYYKAADETILSITHADYGRSWNMNYSRQIPVLLEKTKKARAEIIPEMEKELQRLRTRLAQHDIKL